MVLANEGALTGGPDGMQVEDLGLDDLLERAGLDLSSSEFWYAFTGLVWSSAPGSRSTSTTARPAARSARSTTARSPPAPSASTWRGMKLAAFVISAVYASLSGSLIALMNGFITPDVAGFLHSIELVTMAVLGGAGSVPGAILGAAC